MLNKYRNPRSKRKLKAKAKLEAQAKPAPLTFDVPSPLSPDEILREHAKTKRVRNEPTTFKKERRLSSPYTANA